MGPVEARAHWDDRYGSQDAALLSWYEAEPRISRALVELVSGPDASVIDVGGGASLLVPALLSRGYHDVTVLDVSKVAIETARRRMPQPDASPGCAPTC